MLQVFETTSREGMDSKEDVEKRVEDMKKFLPIGLEAMGAGENNVEHTRALEWFSKFANQCYW